MTCRTWSSANYQRERRRGRERGREWYRLQTATSNTQTYPSYYFVYLTYDSKNQHSYLNRRWIGASIGRPSKCIQERTTNHLPKTRGATMFNTKDLKASISQPLIMRYNLILLCTYHVPLKSTPYTSSSKSYFRQTLLQKGRSLVLGRVVKRSRTKPIQQWQKHYGRNVYNNHEMQKCHRVLKFLPSNPDWVALKSFRSFIPLLTLGFPFTQITNQKISVYL